MIKVLFVSTIKFDHYKQIVCLEYTQLMVFQNKGLEHFYNATYECIHILTNCLLYLCQDFILFSYYPNPSNYEHGLGIPSAGLGTDQI